MSKTLFGALCALATLFTPAVTDVHADRAPIPGNVFVDAAGTCRSMTPCLTNIQSGINAAMEGQVVTVFPGTYHEQVGATQPVTVMAWRTGSVTIDGDGASPVVMIHAEGVTLDGVRVIDGATGITVDGANNTLRNLTVSGMEGNGIVVGSGECTTGTVIDRSTVSDNSGVAITSYPCSAGTHVTRTRMLRSMKGFETYSNTGTVLSSCEASGNTATGVQIGWTTDWSVTGCTVRGNGGNGILLDTAGTGLLQGNDVRNNGEHGIAEAGNGNSGVVTVRANRLTANALSGIALLIGANNGVIAGNTSTDNRRYGMEVASHPYGNSGNSITGNRFTAGGGSLGAALDNAGANLWNGNWYSTNRPYTSPYPVPGTAGAVDSAPLRRR